MRFNRDSKSIKYPSGMNDWYQNSQGSRLLGELESELQSVLSTCFGYYGLQLGCARQAPVILGTSRVKHKFQTDSEEQGSFYSSSDILPIASDSVDLVILMHRISTVDDPHALLREVSRVLIPEGKLIIIDFNPVSFWGIRHLCQSWLETVPWRGHYYTARRMTDWMKLLGFERLNHIRVGYFSSFQSLAEISWFSWIEKGLKKWVGFSSALNVLVYEKNAWTITPVRHRWMTRKLLAGKVARPSVGRNMKYDR